MEVIVSSHAPEAIGPYSQGIATSTKKTLFISGQIPVDRQTGQFAGTTIAEQTEQCLKNLRAILASSQADLSHVVKTTVFLTDIQDFAEMNEVYSSFFQAPYPARSTIAVAALPKGAKIEIEAIAELS